MILVLHILIALVSLGFTTFLYFSPSQWGIKVAEGLVVATLVSGALLVITYPAGLSQLCLTGLGYLAVATLGISATQYKLAKQRIK